MAEKREQTATASEHEDGFVATFIARGKRDRWRLFLSSPRRRREATDRLNHNPDFDDKTVNWISEGGILRQLQSLGAPDTVYLISDETDLDGRFMPLADAVEAVRNADWGCVISCLPGKLAAYRGEVGGACAILKKT